MRPHKRQPIRFPHPWDSPGRNTEVGCHFLLQCMKVKSEVKSLSRVRLFTTSWTAAYQAPPSMGFSRQEYWSGVPWPSPTSVHSPWIFPISLRPDLRHFCFPPFICWKTIELQWLSLRNFPSVLSLAMYCVFFSTVTSPVLNFIILWHFLVELLASNSNYGYWIFGFPFFFFSKDFCFLL